MFIENTICRVTEDLADWWSEVTNKGFAHLCPDCDMWWACTTGREYENHEIHYLQTPRIFKPGEDYDTCPRCRQ